MKSSQQIRQEFISFFEAKGHKFVRSAPVVPQGDPTLLFTNAGMNQFKDVFLSSGARDFTRAVNSQKCIRASGKHNDLEDVGRDNFHHTYFEMLGNWSFGDYFKREAIAWAWELLVDVWGLPVEKLYATVYGGDAADGLGPDTEAENLWKELSSLPHERILRFGKKANFWEMGEAGPCGPSSEIHMDMGEGSCPLSDAGGHMDGGQTGEVHQCGVNQDGCWRFVELWNLVFIQYNRKGDGTLEPLPATHVDTGMGFERIARVLQGVGSNYDTDLFTPLLAAISRETGKPLGRGEAGVAFRVIADHLRTLSFAIADGALPSNEGRGYVLRRILRRASRFGRVLDMRDPFIYKLVPDLAGLLGDAFPELPAQAEHVMRVIRAEEESFGQTLDRGLEIFERIAAEAGKSGKTQGLFPGEEAFKLYDTYGFPADLTQLMARERGLRVDMQTFDTLMGRQRDQARAASTHQLEETAWTTVTPGGHSVFEGYQSLTLEAEVRLAAKDSRGQWLLVLDRTPFYAESGGQVGDKGMLSSSDGAWQVMDTRKDGDRIVHVCVGDAPPRPGKLTARVDPAGRGAATRNHTATHLLQAALRKVMGGHIHQAGSVVAPEHLRFDYTHFEKPSPEQLEEVERLVNREIRDNQTLNIYETGYEDAVSGGVTALFGEKYGDKVRVVKVGDFSAELCGGCHVPAAGAIGLFRIVSESSISAGVRRVVAVTGEAAEELSRREARLVERFRTALNAPVEDLESRLEGVLTEKRQLEKELKALKKGSLAGGVDGLLQSAILVNGSRVVAAQVEAGSVDDLRGLADSLRQKIDPGVAILAAEIEGKGTILCVVSESLVKKNIKAAEVVNLVAALAGGRGGGPPHMATAGAKNLDKLPQAVQEAPQVVETYLKSREP